MTERIKPLRDIIAMSSEQFEEFYFCLTAKKVKMKNRAKCKLCKDIIESVLYHDYVTCKCGEISINGGSGEEYIRCRAKDRKNLIKLDDECNEIVPVIAEGVSSETSKQDALAHLDAMIQCIEKLPPQSLYAPINHADFASLLRLLTEVFRTS